MFLAKTLPISERRDDQTLRAAKELILVDEVDISDGDHGFVCVLHKVEAWLLHPLKVWRRFDALTALQAYMSVTIGNKDIMIYYHYNNCYRLIKWSTKTDMELRKHTFFLSQEPKRPSTGKVTVGFTLVSWCFKPSQPQRIISGLKETFIKRYIVEWTNKTGGTEWESGKLLGEFMEWNTVERAIKPETDTRTE